MAVGVALLSRRECWEVREGVSFPFVVVVLLLRLGSARLFVRRSKPSPHAEVRPVRNKVLNRIRAEGEESSRSGQPRVIEGLTWVSPVAR